MEHRQVHTRQAYQASHAGTSTGLNADVSKVLRNTYTLLAMTLAFSAVMAGVSMAVGLGRGASLICSLGALALVWLVLPRTANSTAGIGVVFAFTGLLGLSLGPLLSYYLALPNGGAIVMQALGGTALVFFSLSAYVLTTKKDFSFMGGFLFAGLMVVIFAALGGFVASLFGVDVSAFSLAISAAIVLLMSGLILFDTSRIVNGGETNYIMATTALYLNIYNLFTSLLHLIGAFSDD
ncbi:MULTISPECIES: Bax inhibitor-1/YccA family protein [Marinobacter]|uniref:Bax inhibitor-1/YccA family protein n=1 Tax=Marinobacter xestospongiae TaxID=994319 RepID=A0ABU3W1F8_9GAMM|nr:MULTISPECIES: Bax inhibitor-1/YccA family protein [Marinobacter]MCG8517186.1 Bax inhibitor-1/YccA family protein [Pseudomonadales bacterium]MCK7566211.1 Bax inhibitor-1/YccA family protein [Marinobacter xestospongiae]MDV2079851.1 Bax inhibitor-1/YccA family protein [Marinobacter xestospongiae]UDL07155.1 Bax inhibitor-1/YccA family protein [Marinobacter sp. CA1]